MHTLRRIRIIVSQCVNGDNDDRSEGLEQIAEVLEDNDIFYVKGKRTQDVAIELDAASMKSVILDYLRKRFHLESSDPHGHVYIKDGFLVDEWEEGGGTHSWFKTKKLRKPTKRDQLILDVIKEINK